MKTLKKFDFKKQAQSTYDWSTILDGGIHVVTKGEDYECSTRTFATMLRGRAKKVYKTVKMNIEGDTITFQAEDMSPERRTQEDVRRSERHAAKLVAKESAKNDEPDTAEEEAA